MSYSFFGAVEVPVTNAAGVKSVEQPVATATDCGSALALQQMLFDLGYYRGDLTGFFNTATFAALQRFSEDVGLPYTPGFYPSEAHCGAMVAAWGNRRITKEPYPRPGVPAVMPSFTPDASVPGIQKTLAALERAKPACPKCQSCAVPAFSSIGGFRGLGAFGLGAFGTQPTIGVGKSNPPAAVKLWQGFLGLIIEPPPKLDGVFGSGTAAATKAFQKGAGLKDDGIVGPATWAKADQVAAANQLPGSTPAPAAVTVPPPDTSTPATVSAGSGPLDNAKAWWGQQPKTTQYAVMGGGALLLVGLVMAMRGGDQEAA